MNERQRIHQHKIQHCYGILHKDSESCTETKNIKSEHKIWNLEYKEESLGVGFIDSACKTVSQVQVRLVRIHEVRLVKGDLNYQTILHSTMEVGLKIINNRSRILFYIRIIISS